MKIKKNKKEKRKLGFTLIEILSVIVILGILMIIAVPSIGNHINNSKKEGYVDTAKSLANGVRNLIHNRKLRLNDKEATYYIDGKCVKTNNGYRSPYGEFEKAYIVVTVSEEGNNYYWTSVDVTGSGVRNIINVDKLDKDKIESDIDPSEITADGGIDGRNKIIIIGSNCQREDSFETTIKINSQTGERIIPFCKKASILHSATCTRDDGLGCNNATETGGLITYGTLPDGSPKAGDAYDCDVNNDKVFDSETERFYYIKSEGNNSVLIHSINVNNQTMYAYDSAKKNIFGPRTGYQLLPSTIEWTNPKLILPGTRTITSETGGNVTKGGTLGTFTYTNKAARFLTAQEVNAVCGITIGSSVVGELNDCTWLLENLGYYERASGTRTYGYWLETPKSNSNYEAWCVDGRSRFVYKGGANQTTYCGVRPAITIKTKDIES